jgi:sulfopyruvate decarboxylase TPP-binding subunit
MLNPNTIVDILCNAGFTHIIWIPDSKIGTWESALANTDRVKCIRPCREGEAIGIAAGLILGRAKPLVAMQCTGLFEAGDALRNVVYDLRLPLKLLVGVRSQIAFEQGKTNDTCPKFLQPFIDAWQLAHRWMQSADDVNWLANETAAGAILLPE